MRSKWKTTKRAALGPITGSPRHSFSRENEKLMDRGWSGDGVERMSENVSGAGPMEGTERGKRMRTRKWRCDDDARELSVIREEWITRGQQPFRRRLRCQQDIIDYDERSWWSIRKHAESRCSAQVCLPIIANRTRHSIDYRDYN